MTRLVKLYITQCVLGFGLSALFVAGLLYMDVARLWSLISNSDVGLLAVTMLWVFNGIVFSGVQFGIAIMRLQDRDTDTPAGGPRLRPTPIPVRAEIKPRRL